MIYNDFLTAQDIITPARSEQVSSATSNVTALGDTQVVEFVHWLNREFILAAHLRHHGKGWSWMKKSDNMDVIAHDSLASAISAGASTFTFNDSTDFDSSGRVGIETARNAVDWVDYSSIAANVATVATGGETITIDHGTTRIHKAYALPTDFARMHKFTVNFTEFIEEEFTGHFPNGGHYAIFGDYLILPRGINSSDASLLYEKLPNDISLLTSTTNIPRDFKRWAVNMTLFHLLRIKRKRGDLETTDQLAERALETALQADSLTHSSTKIRLA